MIPMPPIQIKTLGRRPYVETEAAMRAFTAACTPETADELWLVEHDPVFTLGIAGRDVHVLAAGEIPVVRTDRGGQVTYHGPGQLVAYPLLDLRRRGYFVKEYVYRLEQAVIELLAECGLTGHRVRSAPGVYVRPADPASHEVLVPDAAHPLRGLAKVAALGIKVSSHRAYHGLALNVAMDLEPFDRIDPCGYKGLRTVDLRSLGVALTWQEAAARMSAILVRLL
jgi:lipoyl(octanoyl) transferase